MKKGFIVLLFIISLISCKKNEFEVDIKAIESDCKTIRLDSVFYASSVSIDSLRKSYPFFFTDKMSDSSLIAKRTDAKLIDMAKITLEKYGDKKLFTNIKKDLDYVFKHVKYYYPDFNTPEVYFFISDWNFTESITYVAEENKLFIALNLYLGYETDIYDGVYDYWRKWLDVKYLARDVAYCLALYFVPFSPLDLKPIELMVYNGKILYLTNLFFPKAEKGTIFRYDDNQIDWIIKNQDGVWSYFIANQMLYKSDKNFAARFLEPAPFTKFYLDFDNLTPGQIGQWVGYQIVKSFVKTNPDITLKETLQMPSVELFQKSNYKPERK